MVMRPLSKEFDTDKSTSIRNDCFYMVVYGILL
uniref:Uncharacterized protein n=1 Tax=Anguilla anguilla TaxID=7936 RepID=A0A0E9WF15_ANGAN